MPEAVLTSEMLGQDLVEWALGLSHHSYELVVDDIGDQYRTLSLTQLERAIETASIALVEALEGKGGPFALTSSQLMVVKDTARHDFPLRDMVRGLRIVQRHWTGVLLDLAERQLAPCERQERLRCMLDVLTSFFDDTIDSVMVEYLSERQRVLASAITDRTETVTRILAGESVDDASNVLGIDLEGRHLGLVLWLDDPECGAVSHDALELVAERLAGALGATSSLLVPGDGAALWLWCNGDAVRDEPEVIAANLGPAGRVRLAVGRLSDGLSGFRQTHADARDALRVARIGTSSARVTSFREVSLAALLSADLPRAQRFVSDELGALAERRAAELRSTLRYYLEAHQSLVKTAAGLCLHRNTVIYRLRRIEALLGHSVSSRVLEVHAALDLVAKLGDVVLEG